MEGHDMREILLDFYNTNYLKSINPRITIIESMMADGHSLREAMMYADGYFFLKDYNSKVTIFEFKMRDILLLDTIKIVLNQHK
jgi:hypothetical protein